MTFSTPIMPDQTVHVASAWTGCTGGITALIFADGKEIGAPAVLRRLHDCRTVSWEELHRTLEEDIFAVPASEWDSEQSVAKLKERRAGFVFPMKSDDENAIEMQSCRATEIDCIIASVEDYRSSVARYPDKFQGRKGLYLQQLKDWDQTLQSFSYPARPTWWKRGVIFYAPSKKQQAALPDPVSQVSKARPGAPIY